MTRKFRKYLNTNIAALKESAKTFEDIYNVMFNEDSAFIDNVFCETLDGYRIKSVTFREVARHIKAIAYGIVSKYSISHQYIGIDLDNGENWVAAFWAILMSGNKPFLINSRHPVSLEEGMFKTLSIEFNVGSKNTKYSPVLLNVEHLGSEPCPCDFKFNFENTFALPTSATSLNETICVYSGQEIATQILNTPEIIKESKQIASFYKSTIKQLCFLPFYHIFGLGAVYFWFSFFGVTLVFLKDYSPDTILKTCRRHQATHVFAVPLLWHTIEKQLLREVKKMGEKQQRKFSKGIKLSTKIQNIFPHLGIKIAKRLFKDVHKKVFGPSVQFCISGGSYINDSTLEILNGIGLPLHNGFGMSEIGITSVELRSKPKYRNQNSIGRPFSQVEYEISSEGTLLVRSRSICTQIIVNGKVQNSVDENGWFDTGDFARKDSNGYYYILGRKNDVIIGENGENLNPDIMEKQFASSINLPYCIIRYKDNDGFVPAMIVQINRYADSGYLKAVINALHNANELLPITGRVRRFFFTEDEIASKSAVKVSRQYVQRGMENGSIKLISSNDILSRKPEVFDETQELAVKIKEIISKVLNKSPEDITADLHVVFDLGATSLDYFAIIGEINSVFDVNIKLDEENGCYTVRSFYEKIKKELNQGV